MNRSKRCSRASPEDSHRAKSGADLIRTLNDGEEWLIGSLVHKFGGAEEGDVDAYIQDLESHLPKGFYPRGMSSSSWTNATAPSPENSILERRHNDRFKILMDRILPHCRLRRDELNRFPLAHEEWRY